MPTISYTVSKEAWVGGMPRRVKATFRSPEGAEEFSYFPLWDRLLAAVQLTICEVKVLL